MSDILDAISRRKKAKADAHTSSDLEQFADIVDLMELCAQLEVEQGKIFAALPALKAEFGKEAKAECDKLTARAAEIERQMTEIFARFGEASKATKDEFARLEHAIAAKGTELAEYSKRIEREIPAPVEAKIRALFEAMPVPKDGADGKPGARGKDASLLTGFRGNWSDAATYKAGEWFTFRGSSYLVLRDCKGQVPTKITQTGESAFYAVFAMSGAPGLPGSGAGGGGAGLPDQSGHAGEFLKTDGTDPSWAEIPGGGDLLASNNLSDVDDAATSFANIKQAATEAATGVVELATSAETDAGKAVQASDTRLSNARTPTPHAATHVNGTDDIQNATAAQKGLATAAQITKLDGIEAGADVTDATNVAAAGALMESALGTGVETALGIAVGSAGAPVVLDGAGGTPSSLDLTNATAYPVASTSRTGATPQATAPAAGLLSVLAIANGETVRTDKAIFDTTNPAALGSVGPGTATVAARRDHVHAMPTAADVGAATTSTKLDDFAAPDDNTDLNATTSAHGLLKKLSNVSTEFLNGQGNWATPAGGSGANQLMTFFAQSGSTFSASNVWYVGWNTTATNNSVNTRWGVPVPRALTVKSVWVSFGYAVAGGDAGHSIQIDLVKNDGATSLGNTTAVSNALANTTYRITGLSAALADTEDFHLMLTAPAGMTNVTSLTFTWGIEYE